MSNNAIDSLAADVAPKNFSEFELGLVLAALTYEMEQDENDFDHQVYDNMMIKAPLVLKYWRLKYAKEIDIIGREERESVGNGE